MFWLVILVRPNADGQSRNVPSKIRSEKRLRNVWQTLSWKMMGYISARWMLATNMMQHVPCRLHWLYQGKVLEVLIVS